MNSFYTCRFLECVSFFFGYPSHIFIRRNPSFFSFMKWYFILKEINARVPPSAPTCPPTTMVCMFPSAFTLLSHFPPPMNECLLPHIYRSTPSIIMPLPKAHERSIKWLSWKTFTDLLHNTIRKYYGFNPKKKKCLKGEGVQIPGVEFSYLCTYDLYGPVCNVFDACRSIIREQIGGGWGLEIETFLGSVKWHWAVGRVPLGAQKSQDF